MVDPPTYDETIQILENIKFKYEEHHHVRFSRNAVESAVKLSNRYITDRHLPDKAIEKQQLLKDRITKKLQD